MLPPGITESNISEKYYEPPLMQVIPSACDACAVKRYKVTDNCRGCVAHPCVEVCPKGAISLQNGRSVIDQDKCIKCGKCRAACPYSAIAYETRPCADACGVNAIESDELGRARINPDKCVSCGMCMVNCPFGAIADQVTDLPADPRTQGRRRDHRGNCSSLHRSVWQRRTEEGQGSADGAGLL